MAKTGRPKKERTAVAVSFKMDPDVFDWWTIQAENEGTTATKLLRRVTDERARRAMSSSEPKMVRREIERPNEKACTHPASRRIGNGCGLCGSEKV